jgi:hypothetical protein
MCVVTVVGMVMLLRDFGPYGMSICDCVCVFTTLDCSVIFDGKFTSVYSNVQMVSCTHTQKSHQGNMWYAVRYLHTTHGNVKP